MNSNWTYKKIGDVCTVERGGSPRPIDKYITEDDNGINWIKIGDTSDSMYITSTAQKIIPEGMKKSRYVEPGDFLLSNSMSFGRPYILKIDGCIHDGWLVLRDINNLFDKRFLYYYLSSPTTYQKFKMLAVGGVVNNLNSNMVRGVEIPIPTKEEQKNIANILDKVNELIHNRKQQLQQLDELVKARFVELFYSSNEVVRLDSLIKPYRADKCGQNTYPVLSITMHNGLVLQSERFKKEIASGDKSQYKVVPRNKLVVAFPIDEGLLSAQTIVDVGIVSPAYSLYDIDENKIYPEVLEYILRSDLSIQYYKSKLRGTTLRRRMIPKSDFDSMPINLPSIDRQKQFLNEIKEIDKSKFVEQKYIKKLEILRLYCSCMR